jgi:hypothetical protein
MIEHLEYLDNLRAIDVIRLGLSAPIDSAPFN